MSELEQRMAQAKAVERELYGDDDFDEKEGAFLAEDIGLGEEPNEAREDRIEELTGEIREYKQTAGDAILEIGKRLKEAKGLLPHGEWLPWLNEKVEFSERAAQRFMQLAEGYTNPTALSDLGATKALQLLALSPIEREEFLAEKHAVDGQKKAVEDMSARELEKVLKERDEAQEAQKEAQENLDNMVDELSDAKRERDEAVEAKQAAESSLQTRLEEQEKRIFADLEAERAKVQALKTKSDDLQEKLKATRDKEKEAKAAAENARQELEELKKKPVDVAVSEPSQETLDKLREEVAAAAEEKVKEANARLMEAQAKADAAEAEAEKIRKQLELADQSSVAFKFYFEEWQHKYNAMLGALREVEQSDQIKAEKLKTAIQAAAGKMGTMI